jgi:hypothetical protein
MDRIPSLPSCESQFKTGVLIHNQPSEPSLFRIAHVGTNSLQGRIPPTPESPLTPSDYSRKIINPFQIRTL